jgi:hypothetical protein
MKLFATKWLLILITILFLPASAMAQVPPCKCTPDPPGGEVYCEVDQFGSCALDPLGRCKARCQPIPNDRAQIAAWVITEITGESVDADQFRRERERYSGIITTLLNSRTGAGSYKINYEGRDVSFSLPSKAASLLKQATKEGRDIFTPIYTPQIPPNINKTDGFEVTPPPPTIVNANTSTPPTIRRTRSSRRRASRARVRRKQTKESKSKKAHQKFSAKIIQLNLHF